MPNLFKCNVCGQFKEVHTSGGTGYAVKDDGSNVCYACCAEEDGTWMRTHGRITLYLSCEGPGAFRPRFHGGHFAKVSNWPNTLSLPVATRKVGRHNIAGFRYDVWFNFEGETWHGVQFGDNTQICHCRRVKG